MHRHIALRPSVVVVCSIAILCSSDVARAQAVDVFDPGANQTVSAVAVQPDGKILVGGGFTGLGAGTGATTRNHIGRLNIDGTVDPGFDPGANGPVAAVAVQPDGKILIGGNFTSVGGGTGLTTPRSRIARFNADGMVDATFDPGASNNVYALAVQPDGKILVGGEFVMLGGGARSALGRLNADGTLDTLFNPGVSKLLGVPAVYTMALQPDGKIVVGGYFQGLGGGTTGTTTRNFIGRINADGTLDTDFNPGASSISGVNALALQADGKILVGGTFTGLGLGTGATLRANIGRLNPDGTVDMGFNPGAETQVLTLGVQADGKILMGGYFKWLGAAGGPSRATRNYIGRLNADGSVDAFDPGAGNVVNAVAVQPDGSIVVAGVFVTLGGGGGIGVGTPRNRVGRLTNTDGAIQTLSLTGGGTAPSVETWLRSGAGPEVSRVTFEFSFDGSFYSLLGSGTRISGGWQLTSVNLPLTRRVWLRARGFYGTGYQNGSGSIAESILIQTPTTTSTQRNRDFDGDGKADIAVYRPGSGTWYVLNSGNSTMTAVTFGLGNDIPVPGDYDGDGKTDIAVFRPGNGTWYVLNSGTSAMTAVTWGLNGDIPVPSDYDGDGKTDIAVYRPESGTWYVLKSSTSSQGAYTWGLSGDIPVPGDYDGDGKTDVAVFRPSNGTWFVLQSTTDFMSAVTFTWGLSGDIPVAADYDGDGKADIAIYRPSNGAWYILKSSTNFSAADVYTWGLSMDIPVPADFDGDGKVDVAIYRPSTGVWYVLQSSTNFTAAAIYTWGVSTDIPVPRRP